jgi:hypothetical protein
VTLPLPVRNRLTELILDSLHDREARRGLHAVVTLCADPGAWTRLADLPPRAPADLFEERDGGLRVRAEWTAWTAELAERCQRACRVVDHRALDRPGAPLATALDAAAALFDAGLYYEVHELLEPHWMRAAGDGRETLQGLIQIAVGFQHLANGNPVGARALLRDGAARTAGRRLCGLHLDALARGAIACLERIADDRPAAARAFDWTAVPRFPTGRRAGRPSSR